MGIYSTNRIDGLSSFGESIDFSDPALLHGPSLMEACIEICECDQNMFETLIEFDFMSENNLRTMTESEAIALNEASDKGKVSAIIEKIKGVIDKAITAIKSGAAKVIDKISEVIRADKHLIKKYDSVLTLENLSGFKGLKDYRLPKPYLGEAKNVATIFSDIRNDLKDVKNITASDLDDINDDKDNDVGQFRASVAKLVDDAFYDKRDKFIPSNPELNQIKNGMKHTKSIIGTIKKSSAKTINELKRIKGLIKVARKDDEGENAAQFKRAYDIVSGYSKSILKGTSEFINILKKQLSAYRKAYIICGRYAYNKSKEKKGETVEKDENTNEAVNFAITESSDLFVFGL